MDMEYWLEHWKYFQEKPKSYKMSLYVFRRQGMSCGQTGIVQAKIGLHRNLQ